MHWVQLFGWPAVTVSLLISTVALIVRSPKLALAGVLVALPFTLYMWGTPRFTLIAPVVLACHLVGAYALRRGRRALAIILLLPFVAFAAFVRYLVITQ